MNSALKRGFGFSSARSWGRRRASLLLAASLPLSVGFCGCESTEPQAGTLAKEVGERRLVDVPTADLKKRRAAVLQRYGEIQREVDLKAGLPMGVAIKDDRALLGELYREAHEIERELLRRFAYGDPEVTMEQVKLTQW
jgi:hypothetical protein